MSKNVEKVIFEADKKFSQLYRLGPRADDLWGHPNSPAMKRPQAWLPWLHPDDQSILLAFIAEIPYRKSHSCQFRIIPAEGETR